MKVSCVEIKIKSTIKMEEKKKLNVICFLWASCL